MGDRLAGFCASMKGKEYFGCDPHKALHHVYKRQIAMYGTSHKITTIPKPAEDCEFPPNYFDIMFTSPPYFINEHYSNDAEQSWRRYPERGQWLEKFLFVALKKAYQAIKPKGFLLINLSDTYIKSDAPHTARICDSMCDYLIKLGASCCDCWGLRMHKRPQSLAYREEGIYCEPIWIFRKGPAVRLSSEEEQVYFPDLRGW
jgi:hypothetical protein